MTQAEYDKLCRLVEAWNENRLDLFHLSRPTKDLEIEGVMRFYFCDDAGRVCTKCVRVSSTATTQAVIEALVEKFLPDLRMLTDPDYSIWEVHEGGEERKLDQHEKPLLVQLNWHKDDREGRFLLKKHGTQFLPIQILQAHDSSANIKRSVKRFSKRDKKELKKKHKDIITVNHGREDLDVNDLYKQVPPTTFTRTISNPEIVMKKRREKKLESKLKDIASGGSLKIYGGDVVPSRPYVTLLVSMKDRTDDLLRETLSKYNLEDADPEGFDLIEVSVPRASEEHRQSLSDLTTAPQLGVRERILGPDECPLLELAAHPPSGSDVFFVLRRRTRDGGEGRRPQSTGMLSGPGLLAGPVGSGGESRAELVSLTGDNRRIALADGVTEVGSDASLRVYAIHHIRLPGLAGRHCVITNMDGVVTITPSCAEALIEVNKSRISQTVMLAEGDLVLLGREHLFRLATGEGQAECHYAMAPSSGGMRSLPFDRSLDRSRDGPQMHTPPMSLQVEEHRVWDYLLEVMSRSAESSPFPLSSSFALFLGVHSFVSESRPFTAQFLGRLSTQLTQIAQESSSSRSRLFYWLANASELDHLLSSDVCLAGSVERGQLRMPLQSLFSSLVRACRAELEGAVGSFLSDDRRDDDATKPTLSVLDSILRAARASLLNAAITIQLSSQLLATLNAALFNQLLSLPLSSRLGSLLARRLSLVDEWAERMGVELAAECLLDRCRQAAALLAAPKGDIAAMGATAYRLNSLQVRHLLTHFEPAPDEGGPLPPDVIQRVVGLAERQADETAIEEGEELSLAERADVVRSEVVVPSEGFASDEGPSTSPALRDYLEGLRDKGVVTRVESHPESPGWAVASIPYSLSASSLPPPMPPPTASLPSSLPPTPTMARPGGFGGGQYEGNGVVHQPSTGPVVKITLNRGKGGIGLSIVAAQGVGERSMGIYVKKVIDGTLAARDGRLETGDELLSVNERPLQGLSQEEAASAMSSSGPEVRLVVRKGAAYRNGLSSFLGATTPTPTSNGGTHRLPSPSPTTQQRLAPSTSMDGGVYAAIQKGTAESPSASVPYSHQNNLSQSMHSAFSAPPPKHGRSISSSELYQQNDPNASFSGRSITSNTSGWSQLPAHYRRPTVIQPGRSCPSPSSLRHGATSPSILRPTSPVAYGSRGGAVSPTPLSSALYRPPSRGIGSGLPTPSPHSRLGGPSGGGGEYAAVGSAPTLSSPPLARSSPLHGLASAAFPQTTSISFHGRGDHPRTAMGTDNGRDWEREQRTSGYQPEREYGDPHGRALSSVYADYSNPSVDRPSTTFDVIPSMAAAAANMAQNRDSRLRDRAMERSLRQIENETTRMGLHDQLDFSRRLMSEEEERRYRELMTANHEPASRSSGLSSLAGRRETMIDDVVDEYNGNENDDETDAPSIVGAQEVYRDPRARKLSEIEAAHREVGSPMDGSKMPFGDKMRMFATRIGEGTPSRSKLTQSSAQRHIDSEVLMP